MTWKKPSLPVANLVSSLNSAANWTVGVASVLLLAAIAGVITHIPGNLGVLEAVFVALLSHRMPRHELLAGLVAYRVVYFLVPLLLAVLVYLLMEARAKKATRPPG